MVYTSTYNDFDNICNIKMGRKAALYYENIVTKITGASVVSFICMQFRLFIILKGQVSIHVIQDKDNSQEILQTVENICAKQHLDRSALGQRVWTSGMVVNPCHAE